MKSPQRFIAGEKKPPYQYQVYDYDTPKESRYYFVQTSAGWELIWFDFKENSYRHEPYFNYLPFLKITSKIPIEAGRMHLFDQLCAYIGTEYGDAVEVDMKIKSLIEIIERS